MTLEERAGQIAHECALSGPEYMYQALRTHFLSLILPALREVAEEARQHCCCFVVRAREDGHFPACANMELPIWLSRPSSTPPGSTPVAKVKS